MRRAFFILFVSLLLGMVANIGLCWWLAWNHRNYSVGAEETIGWSRGDDQGPAWYFRSREMFGSTRIDAIAATAWAAQARSASRDHENEPVLPAGSIFHAGPTEADFEDRRLYEDARGWPWRAMASVVAEVAAKPNSPGGQWTYEVREGKEVAAAATPGGWRPSFPHLLPTRFMWRGMILNTIAHTFLLLPLVIAMYASGTCILNTRKRRRRKRGCCEHCGYDLRGAPAGGGCPECGAGRGSRLRFAG